MELKVGDCVNGYKVLKIDYAWDNINRLVCYVDNNKNAYIDVIKSIVAKERFEQMEYRIGD